MFTKLIISFGQTPVQFIQPKAPVIVLKLRGKATGIYGSLDELFDDAVRIILESHRGSVSLLQRKLSIGYARASRIIEMMAGAGILGEYKGSQAREVLMTLKEYEKLREQMEAEAEEDPASLKELRRAGKDSDKDEVSSEPSYISEGQRGYVAVDTDRYASERRNDAD